jgi:hypothetical protein
VPEAASFRAELMPSQRARRWRALAQGLTGLAAGACLLALLQSPSPARLAAALLAAAALGAVLLRQRRAAGRRIAVDGDGTVRVLAADAEMTAVPLYCSASYVCLRAGERLPVWADALAPEAWRRLLVACRWPHGEPAPGRWPAAGRTK